MHALTGRRVLFICPRFFGYERDIADELALRGASVDMLPDRPFDTPVMKAATRFARPLVLGAASRFYREGLQKLGRSAYDIVLVVNGQTLSAAVLAEIRRSYGSARMILYMWDSFQNRGSAIKNLRFFDACFTFDPDCAAEFGLAFRPLFYAPAFARAPSEHSEYDLSFIGTCHSDRYAIVSSVARSLSASRAFYRYLYLQAPWVFYAYRLGNPHFRGARRSEFGFTGLPRDTVRDVFFKSRAILDIEHPMQRGLTIRTLETLGAGRKLITTNSRVCNYDFFRPENICVIKRKGASVPDAFLGTSYVQPEATILRKYSLAGWLDELLGAPDGARSGPVSGRAPATGP